MTDPSFARNLDDEALLRMWVELDMALRGAAIAGTELPDHVGARAHELRKEVTRRGIDVFRRLPDALGVVSALAQVRQRSRN